MTYDNTDNNDDGTVEADIDNQSVSTDEVFSANDLPSISLYKDGSTIKASTESGVIDSGSDTGAIFNTAVSTLPAEGGSIEFQDGVFEFSTAGLIDRDNVAVSGQGEGTVLRAADGLNDNILTGDTGGSNNAVSNVTVKNLRLDGNDANNSWQSDPTLTNGIYAFEPENWTLINVTAENCVYSGINLDSKNSYRGSTLVNCRAYGHTSISGSTGIRIAERAEYSTLHGCQSWANNNGFLILGGNNRLVGCRGTENNDNGLYFPNGSNSGKCVDIGGEYNHNQGYGVRMEGVDRLSFEGTASIANAEYGVWIDGCETVNWQNPQIGENSTSSNDTYDDVYIDDVNGTRPKNVVFDGGFIKAYNSATPNPRYGVNARDCDDVDLRDVQMGGHATAEVIQSGATRPRWDGVIGGGRWNGVDLSTVTGQYVGDEAMSDGTNTTAYLHARWTGSAWQPSDGGATI